MEFTPDLLDDFLDRKVAFFLGAGVSAGVNTRTGQSVKTWSQFLRDASLSTNDQGLITEIDELLNKSDYLFACEILKDHFEDEWDSILKDEYEKIGDLSKLQRKILELQQRVTVTTNFDLFIESNWDKVNTNATHHLQVRNGLSEECFTLFRDNRDYLIKLHGSINMPETMIFSLSDYASKAYSNWHYSAFMEMLLITHTVVFVGFSMSDYAVNNQLEVYAKKYPKNRPHYAFLPDFNSARNSRLIKKHRKLFALPYSSNDNHNELIQLLDELRQQIDQRARLRSADDLAGQQNIIHPMG